MRCPRTYGGAAPEKVPSGSPKSYQELIRVLELGIVSALLHEEGRLLELEVDGLDVLHFGLRYR